MRWRSLGYIHTYFRVSPFIVGLIDLSMVPEEPASPFKPMLARSSACCVVQGTGNYI